MGRHRQQRPTFTPGDFVFAKMSGYRPWPARVLSRHGSPSKTTYNVFFYGTCNTAKVSPANIFDFESKKRSLGTVRSRTTGRNAGFRSAMAHIRRAFDRPEHDFVYYQVLARTECDGENSVIYEMLSSSDELDEADSVDSTEANERDSDDEVMAECISESEEESQPAQKAEMSMPLLDDQDDHAPDQALAVSSIEKEVQNLEDAEDLYSDQDSKSFEFEDAPLDIKLEDLDCVED
ncbi:hypothetical protein KR032_004342 [Drosophila birchii]|nr:hypothetical protein KR032_004342 [Drosophila birchii]